MDHATPIDPQLLAGQGTDSVTCMHSEHNLRPELDILPSIESDPDLDLPAAEGEPLTISSLQSWADPHPTCVQERDFVDRGRHDVQTHIAFEDGNPTLVGRSYECTLMTENPATRDCSTTIQETRARYLKKSSALLRHALDSPAHARPILAATSKLGQCMHKLRGCFIQVRRLLRVLVPSGSIETFWAGIIRKLSALIQILERLPNMTKQLKIVEKLLRSCKSIEEDVLAAHDWVIRAYQSRSNTFTSRLLAEREYHENKLYLGRKQLQTIVPDLDNFVSRRRALSGFS